MPPSHLAAHLGLRLGVLAAVLAASTALAQPNVAGPVPVAPGTTPADIAPAPGLPGPQSVDPAPGAVGPYANHSAHAFYDVDARISHVEERIGANLSGAQKQHAMKTLAGIKSEEKAQIARHGDLLDWARENLNHRLDALVQSYPALQG